jgi:hypothetical protein
MRLRRLLAALAVALFWLAPAGSRAQDMEPRRWTHLPIGLNVAGAGLAATDGDIYVDPVLLIEDARFELWSLTSSYVRTFELLGRSSRVDFLLPYGYGRWEGLIDGEYTAVRRHGFRDPFVRLSMNLYGAPPLRAAGYAQYRMKHPVSTTVGAALAVTLPLGEYYSERLINLGANRWVVRPQLGVLHQRGPWQFEVTTTLSLYQDNDEFYAGTRLEQEPLWFVQGHVIRSFARNMWVSLSGGYSFGGNAEINDLPKDNADRTRYFSLSWGMPLTLQQSIKFAYVNADTNVPVGSSSESLVFSWSLSWID